MEMLELSKIRLTAVQAVALNRQAHESAALAAAASVDGEIAAQALVRFDQMHTLAEQFTGRSLEEGVVLAGPDELVVELAEKAISAAAIELSDCCTRDPLVLEQVDACLEQVIALRELIGALSTY